MQIFTNETHIKRFSRLGQIASIAGLLLLGGGLYISFSRPEQVGLSLGGLLLGFGVSQIGIYLGNRYARFPRPDQAINKSLKGMDRNYSLYHFIAPSAHFLVGPAGMWILLPKPQRGRITYDKGRWKQRGNFWLGYLRIFAQEGIGRPDLEIGAEIGGIKKFLAKNIPEVEFPDPQAALVFLNDRAEVEAEGAPVATLKIERLKSHIRKQAKIKENRLSPDQIAALKAVLEADWAEDETEAAEESSA